jgi:hypothetical protein
VECGCQYVIGIYKVYCAIRDQYCVERAVASDRRNACLKIEIKLNRQILHNVITRYVNPLTIGEILP